MTNARPDLGDDSHYEIRIKGHLDDRWSAWFDGLALTGLPGGMTVIDCPSIDQAALHGLLRQVRDAGLRLDLGHPPRSPRAHRPGPLPDA